MARKDRGQALMAVIAGISLVLVTLTAGLVIVQFSGKVTARQLTEQGQALNAAQAGLTEGLSWFRRQPAQPVTNFAPVRNTAALPSPILDTLDQPTGLVREYLISAPGRVWAHYELRRTGFAGGTNTIDISTQHGKRSNGQVWQLESIGTIFVNNNPSTTGPAIATAGNVTLSRRTLRSEIQRLALNPPDNAALVVNRGNAVSIPNTGVQIRGNNRPGISWCSTCTTPTTGTPTGLGYTTPTNPANPQITGTTPGATSSGIPSAPNRFTIPFVFGMTTQELRSVGREYSTVASMPWCNPPNPACGGLVSLPPMQLWILNDPLLPNKNYQFTALNPLNGTGILVVFGNLDIQANSFSSFNGLIYVSGNYSQGSSTTVNGTVIVDTGAAGTVTITGAAGNFANIRYDGNLINFIARRMGLYTMIRSPYLQ